MSCITHETITHFWLNATKITQKNNKGLFLVAKKQA